MLSYFVFFFQAEDGIRDRNVTGVQTCALPISPPDRPLGSREPMPRRRTGAKRNTAGRFAGPQADPGERRTLPGKGPTERKRGVEGKRGEIGGGGVHKKKNRRKQNEKRYNKSDQ